MSEFSYMKLYPADLLADTTHLTASEFGAYVRLLCSMWLHHGRLPNDPRALGRIADLNSRNWSRIWPRIEPLFRTTEDGTQIWHKRIEEEIGVARKSNQKSDSYESEKCGLIRVRKVRTQNARNPLKNNNVTSNLSRERARDSISISKEKEEEKEMGKEGKKSMVFVAWDTPEWEAWHKVKPKVQPVHSREHHCMGWWFESQWPPDAKPGWPPQAEQC